MITTAAERAAAATIRPRRSSRAKAASSRARAPTSAPVTTPRAGARGARPHGHPDGAGGRLHGRSSAQVVVAIFQPEAIRLLGRQAGGHAIHAGVAAAPHHVGAGAVGSYNL